MDSRVVTRQIRTDVWPLLREHGFTHFSGRSAWRHSTDQVHVVNFQSFNAHHAGVMNITTFSFHLNLGIWLPAIPSCYGKEVPLRRGQPAPPEWACHLRRKLPKPEAQEDIESVARRDVGWENWRWFWIVGAGGENLVELMNMARLTIMSEAFPWFARFADPQEVLRTLIEDEESISGTFGFGAPGSPARNYFIGYVARWVGERERALRALTKAVKSGCFEAVRSRLLNDLARLREP